MKIYTYVKCSKLLINVAFYFNLGESANCFLNFIVSVKSDLFNKPPLALLSKFSDSIAITILSKIHSPGCEDSVATSL